MNKLTPQEQDYYALDSIIPEHIRNNSTNLSEFVESYFEWMQDAQDQPGHILNNLVEKRDIDKVSEEFIEYLQREFATSIPQQIQADPRKLYKQVNDIYRSKGSIPSYEALFNLLFNDQIELYYPRVDLLKPSDGKWDQTQQRYLNNDGFISDKKYIQDSRYYQNFSYVIKTGQTIDYWQDAVKKLLHPAGFAFFGQILIQSFASKLYSQIPPGFVNPQEGRLPLILGPVVASAQGIVFISLNFNITVQTNNALGASFLHFDQFKFVNPNPISDYADIVLEPVLEGRKTNVTLPAEITIINN